MIGKLYSVGINVYSDGGVDDKNYDKDRWWAMVNFQDHSHCQDRGISGMIKNKYPINLTLAIDTIIEDCDKLGINFLKTQFTGLYLMYYNKEDYPPPDDWKQLLDEQAERIGFKVSYE